MKILRTTDIVTLKQGDLEVDFSPMRYDRSLEVANMIKTDAGNVMADMARQTALMIKYSVRAMRGVTDYEDKPIEVKRLASDELSDDDVSLVISTLSKTPFLAPMSYISTSSKPKEFKGVEVLINGKPYQGN